MAKPMTAVTPGGGAGPSAAGAPVRWDGTRYERLLQASSLFAALDGDLRPEVMPGQSIESLERCADRIEGHLADEAYELAVQTLIDTSVHYSHSGYLNQQLNFPLPGAVIGALWGAALNQGQAVFSMSPMTSVIERRALTWAQQRLGLADEAFGISCGGGSLANLSAMLAARNRLDAWGAWDRGQPADVTVLVSRHAHYSISRAAAIVGIGTARVRAMPTDEDGRIDLAAVFEVLAEGGACIVCLSAGTTSTGAFDDMAGFFERAPALDPSRVWVHVDAAHGGSFYSCPHLARQFAALKRADSVCWDLHKVFFQSVPLSFLFFKDRHAASHASRHSTPYLTQESAGDYPDMHNWTLECSRHANAIKLWLSLHTTGAEAIERDVRGLHALTVTLSERLRQNARLTVYGQPDTNIVCFRVASGVYGDGITQQLFDQLNGTRYWSVGHVHLDGHFFIKVCFMNPRLTEALVIEFASEVERQLRTVAAVMLVGDESADGSHEFIEAVW